MALSRSSPIAIIGAGRLGGSLAAALGEAGYPVTYIASQRAASARALAQTIVGSEPVTRAKAAAAEIVFLTVPDTAIAPLVPGLRWRAGQAVVHCSGVHGLDVLGAASAAGALAGCFHPLQSFPSRTPDAARFRAITIGIEATPPLDAVLRTMAVDLDATPLSLNGVDRALYHAAAVFASNHAVALIAAATHAWEMAGLPVEAARSALSVLLLGATENIEAHELADALTGPIARGDVATVASHLAALVPAPALRRLYIELSRELLRLPLGLSRETLAQFEQLLSQEPGGGING